MKSLAVKTSEVRKLEKDEVLLRVDKFAFSHMAIGYLLKGFTRNIGAYHNFFQYTKEEDHYRSACWGYATVVESEHPKVEVGTRLYGLVPPSRFVVQKILRTIPAGKTGDPALVEFQMDGMPYQLRRFQEYEVVDEKSDDDPTFEDWKIATKEIYTMAFYMDENLLVDTGMINCVVISCASSKTALALAYCLRMRDMRSVIGFTSEEHLDFVKGTGVYHEVYTYAQVDQLQNDHTIVFMDFKFDGGFRHAITLRMGTNLMYTMNIGPSAFQQRMKDQLFEKKAREIVFDESSWRERRRQVAEVTKTGRNEKLKYSYKSFVERMKQWISVKHVKGSDAFVEMYGNVFSNTAPVDEVYICNLHEDDAAGKKDFTVEEFFPGQE